MVGDGPAFALVVLFGLNAVDELDRTAFGILLPEIRDEFGLGLQGVLTLVAVTTLGALLLQVPIGSMADRHSRVLITIIGAITWGVFSLLTGLATGIVMLAIVRTGSGIGRATVDPTHNSLIADYYAPANRPRVYSFHRAANAVGAFVGPLTAGLLAYWFSWRVPFIVFAIPTFVFVVLAFRLREPIRGAQERRAMGADEDVIDTEEVAPSFAEGWRMVWKIETLRRIWYSLPFLAASLIGFVSLAALMYEQEFDLDERARGFAAAAVEPFQLVGLIIGARIGTRLVARDPSLIMGFLARVAWLVSGCLRRVRVRAEHRRRPRRQRHHHRRPRHAAPGDLRLALPGHPATGPVDRVLGRVRCGSSPASPCCRSSVRSATASASAGACS